MTVALALTLPAWTANAQVDPFVAAVRDLANAMSQPEPDRATVVRAAAERIRVALEGWDRAIGELESRIVHEAGAPPDRTFQLHVELGLAYRTRGRVPEALRELDAAAALRPVSSDLQVLRALTLERADRIEKAGRAFQAAWRLDATNPVKAYYALQRSTGLSDADRMRARAVVTETYHRFATNDSVKPATAPFLVLDAIPDTLAPAPIVADAATAEGFALLQAGRYAEAAAALTRVDRPLPSSDSPVAHLARGRQHEADNHVDEARREYERALDATLVGRAPLYVGLGRLAQVDGDSHGAIDAYTHAVRLRPNDRNLHVEFASAYVAAGQPDDALAELMAALLVDPHDAQAHAAVGQVFLDTGRNADAVTAFTRALQLSPDGYEVHYALATALTRLGRTADAARQLAMFERVRRETLEQRRRTIATDVEEEEAIRRAERERHSTP